MQEKVQNTHRIFLPLEVKAREFAAKTYFAGVAARRGHEVWLGPSFEFYRHMDRFPPGIFVAHHVGNGYRRWLRVAHSLGYIIVAWDEEGMIIKDDEFYVGERIVKENIEKCRLFFSVGRGDFEAIRRRYPELSDRVVMGGNPRLDILDPAFWKAGNEARMSRPLLLVNSRFSHSNPLHMSRDKFRQLQISRFAEGSNERCYKVAYMDYTDRLFELFVAMVDELARRLPDHQIIVRPHPSESPERWQQVAKNHTNMEVMKNDSAIHWAMQADAVLHNGCTTAIEAALLGRRVIAYCPITNEAYDPRVSNNVSEIATSVDALVAKIQAGPDKSPAVISAGARSHLSSVFAGLDDRTSSETILDTLEQLNDVPNGGKSWPRRRYALKRTVQNALVQIGLMPEFKKIEDRKQANFSLKLDKLDKAEIEETLAAFNLGEVSVSSEHNGWFRMYADAR